MVNREDYIFMNVVWNTGFKHIVPCRGFNLKSWLQFQESLSNVKSYDWYIVSKDEWEERVWGSGSVADTEKTILKDNTRSRRKSGPSEPKDGKKHSRIKQSVEVVTKDTKKKSPSSTRTKKQTDGSLAKGSNHGTRTGKTKALKEAPAKTKPRQKASEDSKAVRNPKRRTPSSGKEARTELRESKVSNVRKSKKNVARDDTAGKETPTRTRSSKSKTQ